MSKVARCCILIFCIVSSAVPALRSIAQTQGSSPGSDWLHLPPLQGEFVDTGLILSADDVKRLADLRPGGWLTPPYWSPSSEQIIELEANLLAYFANVRRELSDHKRDQVDFIVSRLSHYKRQYLGYTSDSKRVVVVNAFCESEEVGEDWRKHLIIVSDGGACVFSVRYNVPDKRFEELAIHENG